MNYTKGEVGILVKEDGYLFFMLLNCTIKGRDYTYMAQGSMEMLNHP